MKFVPFPFLAGIIAGWIVWMLPFNSLTHPLSAPMPGLEFLPFPLFACFLTMFMIGGGFGDAEQRPAISVAGYVLPAVGSLIYATLALVYGYAGIGEAVLIGAVSYGVVPLSWFSAANLLAFLGWLIRKEKEAFLPAGVW